MTSILRAAHAHGKGLKLLDSNPQRAAEHFLRGLEHAPDRGSVLFFLRSGLAEAYVSIGAVNKAVTVLQAIVASALEDRDLDVLTRGTYRMGFTGITAEAACLDALDEIADLYEEAGDHDARLAALERLAEVCKTTTELKRRASTLRRIARTQNDIGRRDDARNTIRLALSEAEQVNDTLCHAKALIVEAMILWNLGERTAAHNRLVTSTDVFQKAADRCGQSDVASQYGVFALDVGDLAAARVHFTSALELGRAAASDLRIHSAQVWLDHVQLRLDGEELDR